MKIMIMSTRLYFLICMLFFAFTGCEKEPKYDIYENHNISACGIDDPLQNIEWLKEYYKNLRESQDISSININLYKVIGTDEDIFQIYFTFPIENDPVQGTTGFEKQWRDCTGKIIFRVLYPGTPMLPESQEKLNEFFKNIKYITEMFHFIK